MRVRAVAARRPEHPAIVYETTQYPTHDSLIQRTTIAGIPQCQVTTHSTLWVPPVSRAPLDRAMMERLGLAV